MYLPPKGMINKDHLKQVLSNQKKFLKLSEVKFINVPKYPELALSRMYPHFQQDPETMQYFPDKIAANHLPDRDYFWNVINTLHQLYVRRIITRARELRHDVDAEAVQQETILVSEEWLGLLNDVPFASSK